MDPPASLNIPRNMLVPGIPNLGSETVSVAHDLSHPSLDSLLQTLQGNGNSHLSIPASLPMAVDPSGIHRNDLGLGSPFQHYAPPEVLNSNDPNAHLLAATGVPSSMSLPSSDFARAREDILEVHIPRVQRLARNTIAGM
jgi:hypothetical protein